MSGSRAPAPAAIGSVLGVLGAFLLLGLEFLARPWVVVGDSMLPALRPGDRVIVDVWTYRHRTPRPAEIVVVRPAPGSAALVKRVARVVPTPSGRDAVWVLGDNPPDSLDSRRLGPIDRERILGRVVLRVWPPPVREFP
jgi:nickel-type superoxide dismutase maturation protease